MGATKTFRVTSQLRRGEPDDPKHEKVYRLGHKITLPHETDEDKEHVNDLYAAGAILEDEDDERATADARERFRRWKESQPKQPASPKVEEKPAEVAINRTALGQVESEKK